MNLYGLLNHSMRVFSVFKYRILIFSFVYSTIIFLMGSIFYFDLDMNLLESGYAYAFKFAFYDSAVGSWIEQSEAFKFRVAEYEY